MGWTMVYLLMWVREGLFPLLPPPDQFWDSPSLLSNGWWGFFCQQSKVARMWTWLCTSF